jgi:hypothetical protein
MNSDSETPNRTASYRKDLQYVKHFREEFLSARKAWIQHRQNGQDIPNHAEEQRAGDAESTLNNSVAQTITRPDFAGVPVLESDKASDYRTLVTSIYEKYAPEKLCNVDKILQKYAGIEDQLISQLNSKYCAAKVSEAQPAAVIGTRVFLDFSINGKTSYRVVFGLYDSVVPLATDNFKCLCTGEKVIHPRVEYVQVVSLKFILGTLPQDRSAFEL